MTDYDNFAGIFTCQKVTFAHRQSATLLSRTKELDKIYVDKVSVANRRPIGLTNNAFIPQMRNRLSSFNVNPFDLSIINQTGCPKDTEEAYHIHVDDDTFSAASIAGAVRKAGEKLGDGVEWTIEAGKKVGSVARAVVS